MSHHEEDNIDGMADEYEMADMDDDTDEEYHGRGLGDSDSDDEEYGQLVCSSSLNMVLYCLVLRLRLNQIKKGRCPAALLHCFIIYVS